MKGYSLKNRTRDKIIAVFRESIRRKHEWHRKNLRDCQSPIVPRICYVNPLYNHHFLIPPLERTP